jgi:pimeloyl-ACP methyl ester carboxylesterase
MSLEPGAWECTAAARFRRPGTKPRDREEIHYRNIKRPTLIIAGAHDPLRLPGYADGLRDEIPGSELVVFPDAGHFPHIDAPEAFNRAVIAFLSR